MNELIKLVMEKTGLPEDQAKQAVDTVIQFLKDRLPDPLAGQVDAAIKNQAAVEQAEQMIEKGAKQLGSLLGGN
jgi:uncharacterized protein (DUF2267 family)